MTAKLVAKRFLFKPYVWMQSFTQTTQPEYQLVGASLAECLILQQPEQISLLQSDQSRHFRGPQADPTLLHGWYRIIIPGANVVVLHTVEEQRQPAKCLSQKFDWV
jgi:hypothetical protein